MVTNKKVFGKAMSMPAGIGIGLGISLILLMAGCAVIAALLEKEIIMEGQIGYGAMVTLFLSSAIGSGAAVVLVKHRRLMVSLLHGSGYMGSLLLINGLLFGGAITGGWVTAIMLYGASSCVSLLLPQGNRQKKIKLKKVHTG